MTNQPLPASDTLAYRMLALTAICGEVPVRVLYRLPGGEQYKEKVITLLKKEKLLRVHSRDHLRLSAGAAGKGSAAGPGA